MTFGMVVLICLLGEGEIIWGLTRLKLRGTKSATCALKFGAGLISWSLILLVIVMVQGILLVFFSELHSLLFHELTPWVLMMRISRC